jgi:hypothetical protein
MKILQFPHNDLQAQMNEILDLLARIEARVEQLNYLVKQNQLTVRTHCPIHDQIEPCDICQPALMKSPKTETVLR